MVDDEVDAAVGEAARLVLGVPAEVLTRSRAEIPEWDSLKHIALLYAVEDACAVRFDATELAHLDSTTAIADAVRRHR